MANSDFTDQLFHAFSTLVGNGIITVHFEDISPINNFRSVISKSQALTHSQSQFVLRLLTKYRSSIEANHLDTSTIDSPKWSQPFRVIDTTKKIYTEKNENGIFICVKQPFSLKEAFDKHCQSENFDWKGSVWDADQKVRKYTLKSINPILVKDFADQKKYEMTQDFLDLVEGIEQVYEDQETYMPYSDLVSGSVELFNSTESARLYFYENKNGNTIDDFFLAKSLGYPRLESDRTTVGEISSKNTNLFWIKDLQKFVDLAFSVSGQVIMILTKEKSRSWMNNFLKMVEQRGYEKTKVKIGFRAHSTEDPDFNDWIRNEGLGGDLSNGKLLIFKDKVPKWLIEKDHDVKIVASSGPFLPSSAISQTWISQQACVIFLGEIKPSITKGQKIVEL